MISIKKLKFINNHKKSYSQCGEDLILEYLFNILNIKDPYYLDIGAHHPFYLSNTYLFYQKGCSGICIEPDPELYAYYARKRRRDILLNIGVGLNNQETEVDFYILSTKTLNTFSKKEANDYISYGNQKIEKVIKVKQISINKIIQEYCKKTPNFISLDVEGLDFQILQTFDFENYRPEVFCVETLTYTENKTERKLKEIIDFMISQNYIVYADTYINTIFVEKNAWENRCVDSSN